MTRVVVRIPIEVHQALQQTADLVPGLTLDNVIEAALADWMRLPAPERATLILVFLESGSSPRPQQTRGLWRWICDLVRRLGRGFRP